jgi:hypothetical protein
LLVCDFASLRVCSVRDQVVIGFFPSGLTHVGGESSGLPEIALSSAFAENPDAAAVHPSAIADRSVFADDMSAVVDHSALAGDPSATADHSSFAVDPSAIADLSAFAGDPSTITDLRAFAIDFSAVADLSTCAVDDCTESNKCGIICDGAILNPAATVGMGVPVRLLGTIATEV